MRWWARRSQVSGYQLSACQIPAAGGDPADGDWPDSRRAPARGLRRRAAEPQLVFNPVRFARPGRAAAAAARGRHRAGQGRLDPAAVGLRQCRRRGAVDEECRRDGAGGIPESQHPAPDQGRRRQPAGRPAGHAAGARRRRGDHSGSAVCAVGAGDGAADARPRRIGDRVLDRFERGRPRRLSPELPAGVRRQPDHRICRQHRQAIVRGAAARERLWQCGGGRVQAGGGPQGRPRRRVREIRRRPRGRGAHRGAGARPGRCAVPRRRRRFGGGDGRRADRGRRESEEHPAARHRSVGQSAGVRQPRAAGRTLCRAGSFRLPQFLRPLPRQIRRRSGANRDAGL